MNHVFYQDKIKLEDITDSCDVGFIYCNTRYKIAKSKNNKFLALKDGEDIARMNGSSNSKQEYLHTIKGGSLEKAHIFKDEETLDKWLNKKL